MNFQKLKTASLHELRVRAAQKVAAFSERRGWSTLVKLPPDDVFSEDIHDVLESFSSRSEPAVIDSHRVVRL